MIAICPVIPVHYGVPESSDFETAMHLDRLCESTACISDCYGVFGTAYTIRASDFSRTLNKNPVSLSRGEAPRRQGAVFQLRHGGDCPSSKKIRVNERGWTPRWTPNPQFYGHRDGHQAAKLLRRKEVVPKKGLEPPHPCGYMDLNHARLPIPPLRLWKCARQRTGAATRKQLFYFSGSGVSVKRRARGSRDEVVENCQNCARLPKVTSETR